MAMNNWSGIGRLTRDPEMRYTSGSEPLAITRFTIAIDRPKDGTDFIRCFAFGRQAEVMANHFHKGEKVGLVGRLQSNTYKDKDGNNKYSLEVKVEGFDFCEPKAKKEESPAPEGFREYTDDDEDDVPF